MPRFKRTVEYPHVVKLPRNSVSPTGSIYRRFDILLQHTHVSTFTNAPNVVRSANPFILQVNVNGKVKNIKSTL